MQKLLLLFFFFIPFFSCAPRYTSIWTPIYKNDKAGNTIIGSKKALINAIRNGTSIQIAWGAKGKNHSIEHISEPIWIAILDESEVIAHLDPQILSSIDWDNLTANYADFTKLKEEWRVVLTTKGEFDAIWYDRANNQVLQHRPQNHIITWFVKDSRKQEKANPLFEK